MRRWTWRASFRATNRWHSSTACWMPSAAKNEPRQMNLRVVLVSPRNPLNIGAAARAMSNFGVFELRLVNPYKVAYLEARSAVKSSKILINSREFETVADAVAD